MAQTRGRNAVPRPRTEVERKRAVERAVEHVRRITKDPLSAVPPELRDDVAKRLAEKEEK